MADIFLSYRRQDSQSATGRLADDLADHFGPGRVFLDLGAIPAGEDFAAALARAIGTATVVLAVVGPDWLAARGPNGRPRLAEPGDYVRMEILAALEAGIPLIPVLVEGARMPAETELPAGLETFARCQAVELSPTRWRADVQALCATLQDRFAIESVATPQGGGDPLNPVERLGLDLLELAAHPRRLIARRQTGQARDHLRAFLFLLACLVAGNLVLAASVTGVLSAFQWVAFGLVAGLLLVALLATPLWLAWRLAGVRVELRQVLLIFAYLYGGAWLGFCGVALLIAVGAQIARPGIFASFVGTMQSALPAEQRLALVGDLVEGASHGPALGFMLVALLLALAVVGWTFAAWGAFRLSLGVGRLRAWAATALWLGLLAGVGWLAGWGAGI